VKLADATVDQARTLLTTVVGVLALYTGFKAPVDPTEITVGCSLLGIEPAVRARPPRDKPEADE
jgi:hypothetical protein